MTLNGRPYPPQKVAQAIKQRQISFSGSETSKGTCGVIIGLLNDICGGDEGRYNITEFLFGIASTKDLDPSHWYALFRWVSPTKPDPIAPWTANIYVDEECQMILDAMGYNGNREEFVKKKSGT